MSTQRRSVSQRLMRAPAVGVGKKIWLEEEGNEDRVYISARVVRQENTVVVCEDEEGNERQFDMGFGELYPQNEASNYEDMTSMQHLHEPGMLENLRYRILDTPKKPYTYMGTVLVAMNPLEPIPEASISDYTGSNYGNCPPHPYAVAELAYARLGDPGPEAKNQALIVSGESGAGKTESSKIVVKYLSERGGSGRGSHLAHNVKATSPVLEAFGNAATTRNPNSSRFGKFLKLLFECSSQHQSAPKLVAGELETYLLEKSRVARQSPGESNFHALHMVSSERKDALSAGNAPLKYLPRTIQVHGRDDKPKYPQVQQAVDAVLLGNTNDSDQAWRLLGAVLALGDIDITGDDHKSHIDPGSPAIMRLSTCLHIDPADQEGRAKLCRLLTHRVVATRGETISTPRDLKNARLAADALARNMYAKCFQGLVSKCNAALGTTHDSNGGSTKFVGILDVFGFEQFSINVFDTLLINFANECLQQHFCDSLFEAELRLFEEEGIEAPEVTAPPDSSATIELLVGRSATNPGILRILDAQAMAGGKSSADSDAVFLSKVHSTHGRHASLARTHPKDRRSQFAIHHYADAVAYTVVGVDSWTEANVDSAPEGLSELIQMHSKAGFAQEALCALAQVDPSSASATKGTAQKKKRQSSVAGGFALSMTKLRETLKATDSAFIRCVKPTPKMIPGEVDEKSCCAQLRALGLLAACEVLKVGLPTRVAYDEIFKKLPPSAIKLLEGEEKETIVAVALAAFEVPTEAYRLGRRRVFFPASAMGLIHNLLAFDPEKDPEKFAVIEKRLKQAKENAGEARKCAKQAREFFRKAEAEAQRADDALREFQQEREANSNSGDDSAPLHHLASASAAKRAADSAQRCAADAERFSSEAAKLLTESSDQEAKQLSADTSQAATRARSAANSAKTLYNEIEPRATTADAARVKAWETASELSDLSKVGVLGQCSTAADNAANAAARLQLEVAQKSRDLAQSLAQEAERRSHEVDRMLKVAKEGEQGVVGQAQALANAESEAKKACDTARTAYDALRQHSVDNALPQVQETRSSSTRKAIPSVRFSTRGRAAVPSMRAGLPMQPEDEEATVDLPEERIDSTPEQGDERTPPGWEAHWDDNYGLYYYFNIVSGETQWEPPTRPARSSTQIDASTVAAALERSSDAPSWLPSPEEEDQPSELQKRTSVKRRSSFGTAAEQPPPPQHRAAAYSASAMTELATQRREGYLMKQGKWTSRWKPRWFVLEDSYLEYFEKKQHAYGRGGDKKQGKGKSEKVMRLEPKSITSFTDTENCFCVTTGSSSWFLVAPNEREMAEWISHINAHILSLRNDITPSADTNDPFSPSSPGGPSGSTGSDFFEYARIAPDLDSVEIRTHASPSAPLTGQRLRPGDVVEITRKLEVQGSSYVRLADFGWAPWLDSDASRPCFIPLEGGTASVPESLDPGKPAKYRLFKGTLPVPLLRGPTHYGQPHGESAIQGEVFEFIAQYTHAATAEAGFERDAYATFFKLGDGRGWAPLKDPNPPHRFLFEKISAKTSENQGRASTRRFSRFLG